MQRTPSQASVAASNNKQLPEKSFTGIQMFYLVVFSYLLSSPSTQCDKGGAVLPPCGWQVDRCKLRWFIPHVPLVFFVFHAPSAFPQRIFSSVWSWLVCATSEGSLGFYGRAKQQFTVIDICQAKRFLVYCVCLNGCKEACKHWLFFT